MQKLFDKWFLPDTYKQSNHIIVSKEGQNLEKYLWLRKNFIFKIFTVVEWKDYHFLAVATISDLQNSYCNQWPHPYEPQISNRFVFSAICLHFTAVLVKFSEKTSAIKTKSPQTKWPYQGV